MGALRSRPVAAFLGRIQLHELTHGWKADLGVLRSPTELADDFRIDLSSPQLFSQRYLQNHAIARSDPFAFYRARGGGDLGGWRPRAEYLCPAAGWIPIRRASGGRQIGRRRHGKDG